VRDDRAGSDIAAVTDHIVIAAGVLGADSPKALQSLRLPGSGVPTATTNCVSASMTTWWLVEYR
jgi:hypothetical protein